MREEVFSHHHEIWNLGTWEGKGTFPPLSLHLVLCNTLSLRDSGPPRAFFSKCIRHSDLCSFVFTPC